MRTKTLLLISLLTLLAAVSVHAQTGPLRANIPFAFSAAGKPFPAGLYEIARAVGSQSFTITSENGKISATVMIQTRTAAALHNTPADAHVVFDKLGDTNILAELWFPGADGYVLNTTRDQHEHRVVDVPAR